MKRSMLLPLALVTACAGPGEAADELVCTAEFVYAIDVQVIDTRTGEPINDISGRVRDGDFVDSLQVPGPGVAHAAGERAGTYSVEVRAPGYQPWDTAGVVATADACHVHTRQIRAALSPVRQ